MPKWVVGWPVLLVVWLVCWSSAHLAYAQEGQQQSGYDGVRLAPTVHFAAATPHVRGGLGVDLSATRWFFFEAWGSRVSGPSGNRGLYPGAWSTGIAINSRIAWLTNAFVYGAGFVYTSTFQCPRGCTILSSIVLEEHRAAFDLLAVQARLGYEARAVRGLFFRALTTFDLPFASQRVVHISRDDRYPHHEPASTFMHVSLVLTLGYAFRLDRG